MAFKRLDRVRRSATPIELDLVESYANGRITRRQFIQRATVIGLSMPVIGAVIAACGPGTASVAPSAVATIVAGTRPDLGMPYTTLTSRGSWGSSRS